MINVRAYLPTGEAVLDMTVPVCSTKQYLSNILQPV